RRAEGQSASPRRESRGRHCQRGRNSGARASFRVLPLFPNPNHFLFQICDLEKGKRIRKRKRLRTSAQPYLPNVPTAAAVKAGRIFVPSSLRQPAFCTMKTSTRPSCGSTEMFVL